ncbi:MAG: tetratricopeptide repeat protein [Desulfobacteraceae bacterium]|nr:tetratricopeptide repeat protein [Desulfobacteraceae bacterium]
MVMGCASQPVKHLPEQRSCDSAIDEAVKRGDWPKALAEHERLLAQKPGDCLALYHLGYIWGQMGEHAKEVAYYEKSIQCGDIGDDLLYFNMGMAKADLGDMQGARSAFEKATTINPRNPENYFGLGFVDQASGRFTEAEKSWQRCLTIDPQHTGCHLALARLLIDQSRWKDAAAHLDAVQALEPDNDELRELRELLESRKALEYKK